MKKKNVSCFVVSFVVEVEHKGDALDVRPDVANLVTDVVDAAFNAGGRSLKGHGVKITDIVDFGAEVE